ncbi:LysR family transcriptional regulator [Cupriavidus plantarum]|uniref:LysR family transcriptional regulator n=1 Tax=Cupriavidus plantarum TaxID=942865 RepID=A0A316EJ84_9BURK|nr:LysR family transcriptional regulator [Cupriavidus plantarum]NYI02380.1 LysR family malonate utilization transcriptional regulator [Cupriavidus plantarum]PWK31585.1 LysR family transcriptional regulator [Cupriavidus plantarum]REE85474.1 LysR family transcriptional regulator [Cupriavidus plantarum]CAG2145875.1 Hca operon transcriptional activator HcaR [Cupriavidus plantarum]SMR86676.1 transcriptional regulator, LysR family [Cupriavidus plantarum]
MPSRISEEITFRKLEALLAFMETGNLAKAAEALDVSTVSVHRALHSLEEGMRCALFRHEGRNLLPTEAAHVLADVARDVLKTMADGIRITREAAGYSADQLKIGSLYSLTIRTVPQVVIGIKTRRPDLQAELVLGSNADLLYKLKQGAIDAALTGLPEPDPEIESIPLFEDDIFFAAPADSRYAQMEAVDLRLCRDEPFVSLGEGFVTSSGFEEAFRIADFEPNIVMKVGDIFSLMNLVGGGIGYTLLPGRVRDMAAGNVALIPLTAEFGMKQTIGLSFLRRRERDPNLLALAAVCRMTRVGR